MAVAATPSIDRILDSARDIAFREGIQGIGPRSVARQAEISPSLVSYHFKGREALLAALLDRLMEEHYAELNTLLHKVSALARHLRSPVAFFAGAMSTLAHQARPRTLLLLELYMQAALEGRALDPAPAKRFWQAAADTFAIDPEHRWAWALVTESTLWYALLDEDPIVSQNWLTRTFTRFAARLDRQPDPRVEDLPPESDEPPEIPEPPSAKKGKSDRSLKVTEAVIRLLARGEKISHRTIAKEAGIPLASSAYLITDKSDILSAAYKLIYELMGKASKTIPTQLFVHPVTQEGKAPPTLALFGQLLLHNARENDNPLLSAHFRNRRGERSQLILQGNGIDADSLDGVVWSLCQGPYSPAILGLPPGERSLEMDARLNRLVEQLFSDLKR